MWQMRHTSWILPDGADRERMLDLDQQLRPVRTIVFVVLGGALVAAGPWLGWWTLVPLLIAAGVFRLADALVGRTRWPEYALLAAWVVSELILAASVAVAGGPLVPMTSWLAIPVLTLGARFSHRGMWLGVGLALALLFAVELGVDAGAVAHDPPLLIAPVALILCVAIFQTVLMHSDRRLRGEIVIDSLTGMLNRKALERRIEELEQQSRVTRQPVAVIVGDIDHFKQVNDVHGHAAGDGVLVDVSYSLRKSLRAFDLCYRTGGEEFLVLLPGANLDQAEAIAEQLRESIELLESGSLGVTMSFGVAASADGEPLDYAALYARADSALYEAKHSGRNRVFTARAAGSRPQVAASV